MPNKFLSSRLRKERAGETVSVDDRKYELATDDVVTLPEANAGALVERETAERLE
ncbi:hypothetical protein [Halalkalicoccus tibetensis]|uniref:Uncharacterized protein n=1 Tax=Halalkalicoccus tibetensis TaxID=175632 RepID=A0ABD5V6T0_9EURY